MFLLVSVRHVGAHPDELQHGVSIQSSINLGKKFPRISRIRITFSTQILARVFVYLPPFTSQILDFICRMVLIFILIYFEWRDIENQQYARVTRVPPQDSKSLRGQSILQFFAGWMRPQRRGELLKYNFVTRMNKNPYEDQIKSGEKDTRNFTRE